MIKPDQSALLCRGHQEFLLIRSQTSGKLKIFFLKVDLLRVRTITSEGAFWLLLTGYSLFVPPIGVSSSGVSTFVPVHLHREISNALMLSDRAAQADLCHVAVTDTELLTTPHIFWLGTCFWNNSLQCFGLHQSSLGAHICSAQFCLQEVVEECARGSSSAHRHSDQRGASPTWTLQNTV